ncbi:hypothetical protein HK104_003952 [Borealophlyctis nickersoniae]|nr:hypothetical protein HK104_003952 [Borealophlyctis nickersoniae]
MFRFPTTRRSAILQAYRIYLSSHPHILLTPIRAITTELIHPDRITITPPPTPNETITSLLGEEHLRLETLYKTYRTLPPQTVSRDRRDLGLLIAREANIHDEAEEEVVFRPIMEDKKLRRDEKGEDLYETWVEDHFMVKQCCGNVENAADVVDDEVEKGLDQQVLDLIHYLHKSSKFEEDIIFPRLERTLPKDQLIKMAREYREAKKKVPPHAHPYGAYNPHVNKMVNRVLKAWDTVKDKVQLR